VVELHIREQTMAGKVAAGVRTNKSASAKKTVKESAPRTSRKQSDEAKRVPWTFPKHSLEEAIRVAKAIEDKNGGNPMRADMLTRALGFHQPNDWRFLD